MDAVGFGFALVKKDLGLMLPFFVGALVIALPGVIFGGIRGGVIAANNGRLDPELAIAFSVGNIVVQIIGLLLRAWIFGGMFQIALDVARGNSYSIGGVFSGGKHFLSMLVIQIVLGIAIGLGCMCLVAPGVFLMLALSQSYYCAVDQGLGPIEAIQKSWSITEGQKGDIFVLALIVFGITLLAILLCCLPVLFVTPVAYLAGAYAYLKMTGQTVTATPA